MRRGRAGVYSFVVDASDEANLGGAKKELDELLSKNTYVLRSTVCGCLLYLSQSSRFSHLNGSVPRNIRGLYLRGH